MKYTNSVEIHKPIDEVIEKFQDSDAIKHWQEGFQKIEKIKGERGEEGSQYKLFFKTKKREMQIVETLLKVNLPDEFIATYVVKNVWNQETSSFVKKDDDTTQYTVQSEFKFSGFMKIIGGVFPKMFKKQSLKYMNTFKDYVENGTSVLNQNN